MKTKDEKKCLEIDSNLNIWNQNNKIIVRKELKLKNSQTVIHKSITPKCQLKRNTFYEKKFNWISIWYILNNTCKQTLASSNGNDCITLSIKNIDYKKMGKSNDQCHFCKNEIESLMHLFYRCHTIKPVLRELKHVFKIILENNIVLVEENLIIGVYKGEITEYLLLVNLVMCILKWKHEIT